MAYDSGIDRMAAGINMFISAAIYEYSIGAAKLIAEAWADEIISAIETNKFNYVEKQEGGMLFVETGILIESIRFKVSSFEDRDKLRSQILLYVLPDAYEPRTGEPVDLVLARLNFGVRSDKINIPERPILQDSLMSIGFRRIFSDTLGKAKKQVIAKGYAKSTLYKRRAAGKPLTQTEKLTLTPRMKRGANLEGQISVDGHSLKFNWITEDA